jgi:hypothetical protein
MPLFPDNGFLFSKEILNAGGNSHELREQLVSLGLTNGPTPNDVLLSFGILKSATKVGAQNFFDIVFQVSPHGASSIEDLPVLDSTDSNQWLLIVAVRKNHQLRVYRRLYHKSQTVTICGLPR